MDRNKYEKYQSDVIVDLLKQYDIKHISMNPGASFRGLHDSIINYGENDPELMVCQHEEIAVQIAHGYARATGKPMGVILHNLVGMLHAQMAVYYAYIDRAPIFIMGATGPMHEGKRRPHIDWSHSALVQGEAMRNYTKWDYQPHAIEGVPESFMRAYSTMVTEPAGPIYMCYDAWLQEEKLTCEDLEMPPEDMQKAPAPMGADPATLDTMADVILNAKHPVILVDFIGRQPGNFEKLVMLAETLARSLWPRWPVRFDLEEKRWRHYDAERSGCCLTACDVSWSREPVPSAFSDPLHALAGCIQAQVLLLVAVCVWFLASSNFLAASNGSDALRRLCCCWRSRVSCVSTLEKMRTPAEPRGNRPVRYVLGASQQHS